MDDIDVSFFDHIDGLLDFPTEDIDSVVAATGKSESILPGIWSDHDHDNSLLCSDSVFFGAGSRDLSLAAELSIPYEDIVQLEWLSTFVEESFSGGSLDMSASAGHVGVPKNDRTFQTSSPVSVLESSSSSSSSSCSGTVIPGKCGRARSKRPRPASFSPRPPVIQLPQCSVHESKKKNKKIKLTLPPKSMTAEVEVELKDDDDHGTTTQVAIRKCLHCNITKTPQWRAGPLGPKTLCNACGVRYKSGRLFPEYRPAASPTFVPLLHSNSHKKVLEMRSKTVGNIEKDASELIPNLNVSTSVPHVFLARTLCQNSID